MRKKTRRKFYRLNQNITASRLRVIDNQGKQVGVFDREEALRLARQREVDLVEIAPQANPPVCKLIEFKKFLYFEKKRQREQRKGGKTKGIKEFRLRPFIGEHDYQYRLTQAKEFLSGGGKIRLRVPFFGREIKKKKFGFEIVNRLLKDLGAGIKIEREPCFIGKNLVTQIAPDKNYGQEKSKTKSKDQKDRPKKV